MKHIVMFLLSLHIATSASAQDDQTKTDLFLQRIRMNDSELSAFFHQMPKGGDLHHHFSGAVYAETFFDSATDHHFLLDTASLIVYPPNSITIKPSVVAFDSMNASMRSYFKNRLIRLWSIKDFEPCDGASDAHFFATFNLFGPIIAGNEPAMLQEIKQRAIAEHTDYIETMFIRPSLNNQDPQVSAYLRKYNPLLQSAQAAHDTLRTVELFNEMAKKLNEDLDILTIAQAHHNRLVRIKNQSQLPNGNDSLITIRFLNYVTRVSSAADVFAQLYLSFASCDMDSLIVGVNIVAPENADVSMHDYWLHMNMFKLFRAKYPQVHTSLHAGELVSGMVKPEDLTSHISDAIYIARAERIGHGVDIAYENNTYELLHEMAARKIAVEVNLTSNDFILGVKGSSHPISLYYRYGVPIVISTDDPGVLRSDHSGEFVKLIQRYPQFSYADVKRFVYNSIEYSFLKMTDKSTLKNHLDREFAAFERMIASIR